MACDRSVARSDHGDRFGQAISRVCTTHMCPPACRGKATERNKVVLAREEKKVPKTTLYTHGQLERLSALSDKEGAGEAELLRKAIGDLLKKFTSIYALTAAV